MSQTAILELLLKVLVIIIVVRLCLAMIPVWALGVIGLFLLLSSGLLNPVVMTTIQQSLSPLAHTLLPFIVILVLIGFMMKGLRGRK